MVRLRRRQQAPPTPKWCGAKLMDWQQPGFPHQELFCNRPLGHDGPHEGDVHFIWHGSVLEGPQERDWDEIRRQSDARAKQKVD